MSDPYTKALAMIEELRAEYDKIARKHARLVELAREHKHDGSEWDAPCELCAFFRDEPETTKGEEKCEYHGEPLIDESGACNVCVHGSIAKPDKLALAMAVVEAARPLLALETRGREEWSDSLAAWIFTCPFCNARAVSGRVDWHVPKCKFLAFRDAIARFGASDGE